MSLSLRDQKLLALTPKVLGFTSGILSSVIVLIVVCSPKRRKQTFHRMMAGMSLVDVSTSFWGGLSTWPTPSDSPRAAIYAAGNETTCKVQGFFTNMAIASILYNCTLSFYYLFVIRYGWRERTILRIEPYLHGIPLLWAVGTGFACLFLDAFGFATFWCWISSERDDLRWAFFYGPLWLSIILVLINSFLTWSHVLKLEKAVAKYTFRASRRNLSSSLPQNGTSNNSSQLASSNPESQDPKQKRRSRMQRATVYFHQSRREFRHSRKLARQCFLFAGGFYLTWTTLSLTRFLQIFDKIYFGLLVADVFFVPWQGLPNFLVYLLPEIEKFRKQRRQGFAGKNWMRWTVDMVLRTSTTQDASNSSHFPNASHAQGSSFVDNEYDITGSPEEEDENNEDPDEEDKDDDDEHNIEENVDKLELVRTQPTTANEVSTKHLIKMGSSRLNIGMMLSAADEKSNHKSLLIGNDKECDNVHNNDVEENLRGEDAEEGGQAAHVGPDGQM